MEKESPALAGLSFFAHKVCFYGVAGCEICPSDARQVAGAIRYYFDCLRTLSAKSPLFYFNAV